jgi:hypothetical protein
MAIQTDIEKLLQLAVQSEILEPLDVISSRNLLLDLFGLSEPASEPAAPEPGETIPDVLARMVDHAGATAGLTARFMRCGRCLIRDHGPADALPRRWPRPFIASGLKHPFRRRPTILQSGSADQLHPDGRDSPQPSWRTPTIYGDC